jgi:hypothetical protein
VLAVPQEILETLAVLDRMYPVVALEVVEAALAVQRAQPAAIPVGRAALVWLLLLRAHPQPMRVVVAVVLLLRLVLLVPVAAVRDHLAEQELAALQTLAVVAAAEAKARTTVAAVVAAS